jgi:L-seryl-tRNA(Ser) seleniumtransferase
MNSASASDPRADLLRTIPSVDDLLRLPRLAESAAHVDRALLVDAARAVLDRLRQAIVCDPDGTGPPDLHALAEEVVAEVARSLAPSLVPVINATGVILHTNLGRAPLAAEAVEHMRGTAIAYSNLEYDLAAGARGRRDVHIASRLARLTGAESAVVVNNNAAAVFLVLAALARGGEVVVSRGELIEIGESFRIPDVMAESGALLREVGTTNRTALSDYERAIGERTRLLLRVHRSNFRIVGFTARPSLADLVGLGRRSGLPVYEDLGSGCLVDLSASGVGEPLVRASLEAGVDIVSFSADKLLGGPQAGIIAGQRELIARVRKHPLFRALRVDKLVIAALEATLLAYLRGDLDALPALRMVRLQAEEIERRARSLADTLRARLPQGEVEIELAPGESVIGGGSTPGERLPTCLLFLGSPRRSGAEMDRRLRMPASGSPVLARIANDRLVVDLRTVFPEQEPALATALAAAFR